MSFMDAISYPFKDSNWITKFLITLVLACIPILGWLVISGYVLRVTRMVQNGQDNALPEWDDFGGDFVRGLMGALGGLIYYLPAILLNCCTSVLSSSDSGAVVLLTCCLSLIQLGYVVLMIPIFYTALSRYAQTENFSDMLDFGANFKGLTDHTSDAVMLWVNSIVLGIIMGIVISIGLFLLCIPGLIAIVVYWMASGHLVGQWGRVLGIGSATPYDVNTPNYA